MKHVIQVIFCIMGAVLTCSCYNVVEYDYDNIGLYTRSWHYDLFVNIEIGGPHQPYTGTPALLIKMSDGTILNLATATVDEIRGKCPSIQDWSGNACSDFSTRQRPPHGSRWPEGTIHMQDYSRQFYVLSNQVIAARISWDGNPWPKPEVGNPITGEMYTFPLSKKTVVTLFGKPTGVLYHSWE